MELEFNLKRLESLLTQIQECKRLLLKNENRLDECLWKFQKHAESEDMIIASKSMRQQRDVLYQQRIHIEEMMLVLERIADYYAGCEERVIEADGTKRKRFSEEMNLIELKQWKAVSVSLER